jgi:hypothetical protein
MITSWADEEDKANAKYDAIRGNSKQNTGGNNKNNGNQGDRSNNYSGPNRKRKPDNTIAAIQRPAKDNSKKTSGGFKDLLKEKCPWHLDGNHTTEQCYQLVLKPVVAGSKLNKVLIGGGSGLNVIFTKTLKKMKLDITHMLTKSTSPFYGIVPGNTAIPLGSVVLPVTFGETRDNYCTEYVKFEVADFEMSYHAIIGTTAIAEFMAVPHYTDSVLKMPSSAGVLSLQGDLKISFDCDTEAVELAATNQVPNTMMEINTASKKLAPSELDTPEKSDKADKPQLVEEVQVKTIDLGTGDNSKTTTIRAGLDPK